MPREDIVIYLKVPSKEAMELTLKKEKREYLKGEKVDIHESDVTYRNQTEAMYDFLAQSNSHWKTLECIENGTMISKETIHTTIVKILKMNSIL